MKAEVKIRSMITCGEGSIVEIDKDQAEALGTRIRIIEEKPEKSEKKK